MSIDFDTAKTFFCQSSAISFLNFVQKKISLMLTVRIRIMNLLVFLKCQSIKKKD